MLEILRSRSQALDDGAIVSRPAVPPRVPTHPWSSLEMKKAENLLEGADWPTFTDIYSHVKGGAHELIDVESLVSEARTLQLTLLLAKDQGHFEKLEQLLTRGQKGMENMVMTDNHEDGRVEKYYEKTAGDLAQSFWCRKYLLDMSDCFQVNPTQAAIARWLQLPHLMLSESLASTVLTWSEHPLADFQEQATLYMPACVVHLYLEVCTAYHVHFIKESDDRLCQHRNNIGLLCCNRLARKNYGRFCSCKHFSDERCRVIASFDGPADYGAEYLDIRKGDMVLPQQHGDSGGGWSYVTLLRTMQSGWVPTAFAEHQ